MLPKVAFLGSIFCFAKNWADSPVGRTPGSQSGGRGFESPSVHQILPSGEFGPEEAIRGSFLRTLKELLQKFLNVVSSGSNFSSKNLLIPERAGFLRGDMKYRSEIA